MENEQVVYVKFQQPETLRENGRHLFAILNAFAVSGYQLFLCSGVKHQLEAVFGHDVSAWPHPARLAMSLPGLTMVESVPPNVQRGLYIFDQEDHRAKGLAWRKRIHIKFDLFSSYCFSKPIIMPYPMHPLHATPDVEVRLQKLRTSLRNVRVLFAGDSKGYKRRWIRYPHHKLPRLNVLGALNERLGDSLRLINTKQELDAVLGSDYVRQCVLLDNEGARVEWGEWLQFVAHGDFFICPPGIVMPMCHNIIEAMAVGSIPITNYPEWFSPELEHMKNCLVFSDEADLIEKVQLALNMGQAQLAKLRENAISYYETHLLPKIFVKQVEAREEDKLTVLMYSEYNVAKKSSRLNKRSILLRGENNKNGWFW